MQQDFVLALRKVIEQTGLSETIGLQIMPDFVTQVTLVKIDVKNADDCASLVLLVSNFLVDAGDLKVIKDALGEHVAD